MGSDCRQYANLGTIVLAKNASIVSGEKTYEGGEQQGREDGRETGEREDEGRGNKQKERELEGEV